MEAGSLIASEWTIFLERLGGEMGLQERIEPNLAEPWMLR